MKNSILILLSFLLYGITYSQIIKGVVIDSITKEPVPYVNIWYENENIGTTTAENGEFSIKNIDGTKTLVFSSIGYEIKRINANATESIISLNPKTIELQEAVIIPRKATKEKTIGEYKKSEIDVFFFKGEAEPWILARLFRFVEEYRQTPFLNKIQIFTSSEKNAKFNIRLYTVNDIGEPGNFIYDENILGIAKKGKNNTEIDVSALNIKFPVNGLFIAIERLIIDQNMYELKYTMQGSNKQYKGLRYEPSIGTLPCDTNENSWIYLGGKWLKMVKYEANTPTKYKDMYNLIAIQLTLTN